MSVKSPVIVILTVVVPADNGVMIPLSSTDIILPSSTSNDGKGEIESFRAVNDSITVSLGDWRRTQIRGFVTFRNGDWGEAYNDYGSSRDNYPPMIDADIYHMTFDVEDGSIISVDDSGIITPLSSGTTTVTITMTGGFTDTVTVTVE